MNNPQTFNQWKTLVASDPSRAADTFFHALAATSPQAQSAAVTQIQSQGAIVEQFIQAALILDNPLAGIPYLLKDLFDVAGQPTAAGSSFLPSIRPTPEDSCLLYKTLAQHRAVYCGKTQLNEFAYGLSGENPHFGDCPHPHVSYCLSGGSSSGSAWAVGAGITPLAFGTDTGGSIRVPAAFCGVLGMRVPHQTFSKQGVFPLSPSFDTVGWFTQTAADMQTTNAALIDSLAIPTQPCRILYFPGDAKSTARGLNRGYDQLANHLGAAVDPETNAWLAHSLNGAQTAYTILQSREAYQVHRTWLDSMKSEYDPVVWARINQGRTWSTLQLEQAQAKRQELIKLFFDIFTHYDAILMPATLTPSLPKNKLTHEFRQSLLRLTAPASMATLPVLTLPVHLANRLSGGLQVIFPSIERTHTVEVLERSLAYYQH